ncbi:MAG TPA: type II secretion system minor pseudopilin GspK [Gammaproteobacteria bacterium]
MRASLKYNKQKGVALITALLIVALAAAAAAWLTNTHQLSIRRSGNLINGDQAYAYALGLEALAIAALNEDFKQQGGNTTDGFSDVWAVGIAPFPVPGGMVSGRVIDLQGLFNLNSLFQGGKIQPVPLARFRTLLRYLELDDELANAVIDWLDADTNPYGPSGAEDDYYTGLERPYRTANGPFTSVSELRMVKGFDVKQFDALSAALSALPVGTPINVNTAPAAVHIAIGASEAVAEALDQNPDPAETATEPEAPNPAQPKTQVEFDSIDDYVTFPGMQNIDKTDLALTSSYFLFEGEARIDRGYSLIKTILYRDNSGNMRVVMRSQGTL